MIFLQLFFHSLELTAPHVFQIHAVRPRRCRLIKENRNPVTPPDLLPHVPREGHAIFQRYAFHGNKRHHVCRSDARVSPLVLIHIDQFHRFASAKNRGFRHRVRVSRQRNHAAVVVRVHLVIQHPHSGHLAHRLDQRIHFRFIAPFAEIRHALNQSSHGSVTPPREFFSGLTIDFVGAGL